MEKVGANQLAESALPVWRCIATTLAREIRQGRWRDGEALPAAGDLAVRFGVHRHTVRKSLSWLRAQGLLRAQVARARAVVPRLPLPLPACAFLPEHLQGQGLAACCELLACTTVAALPASLRERVPARLPGPLLHLAYQVTAEGQLVAITEAWLPAGAFSSLSAHLAQGRALGSALRLSGAAPACRRHSWIEVDAGMGMGLAPTAAHLGLCVGVLALDAQSQPLKLCVHHLDAARMRLLL